MKPWFKALMTTLWTDHVNTNYIQALSGWRRINKKIIILVLEVIDIPYVHVWPKGVTDVLADVLPRRSPHVGKITGLVRNLPLPPVRVYEIVRKIVA